MQLSLCRHVSWVVGLPLGLWFAFLAMAIDPYFQRQFLYAHNVFPWWEDTNQPQYWGFAKNQVTPFHLTTADGERIHAWHILPLSLYHQHQETLLRQPEGYCDNITTAASLRLLQQDPDARLVLFLHGNAGHLPTTIRSSSFHTLTDTSPYHVLAIDYRGFGRSSGFPTEDGLIQDAVAAVDFVLHTAGLAPDRVLLLGHSLGTAVAVAVAEHYAVQHAVDFAGLVLVAGFSSLPTMLSHYAIAGSIPIFGPLRLWPRLMQWLMSFVVDRWASADRLDRLVGSVFGHDGRHLRLGLVHAADDWDIPSFEDDKLFSAVLRPFVRGQGLTDAQRDAAKEEHTVHLGDDAFVTEWRESNVVIRQERFPHGGHNGIMKCTPVVAEVMRTFARTEE